jgi:hypothetical protein
VVLRLATYNAKGVEQISEWEFTPTDIELEILRASEEGESTSGTEFGQPVYLKASYNVMIGAGTLRAEATKKHLLRLLGAHKVLWKFTIGTTTEWRECIPVIDRKVVFEYLEDIRSLPRLKLTLVERKAMFAPDFEKFFAEKSALWQKM